MKELRYLLMLSLFLMFSGIASFATTVNFNAYGASTGLSLGDAELLGTSSLAFSGFDLSTTGYLQLDAPGYDGAVNYELVGDRAPLTVTFTTPQSNFSIDLRDYSGYSGQDTISVYGADDTTLLNTYVVSLAADGSILTFTDPGESALIGAVTLSETSTDDWTGILQDVTYNTSVIPEPSTFLMLVSGLAGLAGVLRRKIMA